MHDFEFAKGSIIGRDHRVAGKNCQDAMCDFNDADEDACFIGIVADGCGSSDHSEVGAKLGVRLAVNHIVTDCFLDEESLETARQRLLNTLLVTVDAQMDWRSAIINDFFLFTLVGIMVTRERTTIFTIGDGYAAINGKEIDLGAYAGNQPPYIAYALTKTNMDPELLKFKIHVDMPTSELQSFVIGTDGMHDFAKAAEKPLPGKAAELVGPVSQFWENDKFFRNPDMVRRRLMLVNGGIHATTAGHLSDDTTLIVGRRKQKTEATNG